MSIWLFVRLGGVALGIVTLLGFASGYLNVVFNPYFKSVLGVLREIANLVVGAPLWEMFLDRMREQFTWIPHPAEHWRPIYSLMALLLLSLARPTGLLFAIAAIVIALLN